VAVMLRTEANGLMTLRDTYCFKMAILRFSEEKTGVIEGEFDYENEMVHEQEDAEIYDH